MLVLDNGLAKNLKGPTHVNTNGLESFSRLLHDWEPSIKSTPKHAKNVISPDQRSSSSFSSFLSDLSPRPQGEYPCLLMSPGFAPNFKKPLIPFGTMLLSEPLLGGPATSCAPFTSGPGVDIAAMVSKGEKSGNSSEPNRMLDDHCEQTQSPLVASGMTHSHRPVVTMPIDGDLTYDLAGVGVSQAFYRSVQEAASPFIVARQLDATKGFSPGGSSSTLNNSIAKNILSRSKNVGFSFVLPDGLEVSRLEGFELKDCEVKRGMESVHKSR